MRRGAADGVRLSATSRAVREDGAIIALKNVAEKAFGGRVVYIGLGRVLVEDLVECECLVLDALSGGAND